MPKLWHPYNIPIIGLAGEPNSGKTLWGLTIDPDSFNLDTSPATLIWDTEGSSTSYEGVLSFKRVDIPHLTMQRAGNNYSTLHMFEIWREDAMLVKLGRYRVCILDTINEIEDGLAEYVKAHPSEFGYTASQFAKSGGLFWGAVKHEWKRLLMSISQKCETLVLTTHMRSEFRGAVPTGKRIPGGKDTIMDITSLYMTLTRRMQAGQREIPLKPSGICKWPGGKSRLVAIGKDGTSRQLLPPHIPDASPDGIRYYLQNPPDFNNLKLEEQAIPEQRLTNDDKLAVQAGIASDENARAQADLSRVELEKEIKNEKKVEVNSSRPSTELENLKTKLLGVVPLEEARVLLRARYKVSKLSSLTLAETLDLDKYIDTLGK